MSTRKEPEPRRQPGTGGLACGNAEQGSRHADLSTARFIREQSIVEHLTAVRRLERIDRRQALAHVLAAIALVVTRDNPVASHGARVALAAGGGA